MYSRNTAVPLRVRHRSERLFRVVMVSRRVCNSPMEHNLCRDRV